MLNSLIVSWNIGVRCWLLVASVVSPDSVGEESLGVHTFSNEFVKTQFSAEVLPQFSL